MNKSLRRVSVAVDNLEDALGFYRDALGLTVMEQLELPEHGLRLARLAAGEAYIELLQPTDDAGPIALFLDRRGMGLHHIAITVEDIEQEMRALMARGVQMIDHEAREGPDGRVAFIHPSSTGGVLIEMTEVAPPPTIAPPTTTTPA
jgi:methylmalonyl-CoA/ethylmalonyl-CoA epimerase